MENNNFILGNFLRFQNYSCSATRQRQVLPEMFMKWRKIKSSRRFGTCPNFKARFFFFQWISWSPTYLALHMLNICVSEEHFLFDFFNVFCHVDKNNSVEILFWWQRPILCGPWIHSSLSQKCLLWCQRFNHQTIEWMFSWVMWMLLCLI